MPRKLILAEALAGRKAVRKAFQVRKRSTARLTRNQRVALAPREPRGPALRYLQFQARLLENIQAVVMEKVDPLLPELEGEPSGVQSAPDPLDAQVGVRADARAVCPVCGPAPAWYQNILEGKVRRYDAPGGRWAEVLAFLEVAITEMTGERRTGPQLEEIGRAIWAHNRAEMSRVLQIDLRRKELGLQDFIQRFIQKNVQLIRSVATDQLTRMEQVVARSTGGQARVETLRNEIQATFNVTRARAALIARDQTLKANSELIQLRQQQAGVTEYIWTTSRDERVRGRPGGKWAKSQANHWDLDGTRQSWLVPPVTNPVTGARNHPGQDYQCRCTATPIVDHLLTGEGEKVPAGPRVEDPPPVRQPVPLETSEEVDLPLAGIVAQPSRSLESIRGAFAGLTPAEATEVATGLRPPVGSGPVLPPITLTRFPLGAGPDLQLTDGNHRVTAAIEAGATHIRAEVVTMTGDLDIASREIRTVPLKGIQVDLSRQSPLPVFTPAPVSGVTEAMRDRAREYIQGREASRSAEQAAAVAEGIYPPRPPGVILPVEKMHIRAHGATLEGRLMHGLSMPRESFSLTTTGGKIRIKVQDGVNLDRVRAFVEESVTQERALWNSERGEFIWTTVEGSGAPIQIEGGFTPKVRAPRRPRAPKPTSIPDRPRRPE
jgi:hypothetical protein